MSFGAKHSISAEVYSSLGETPETASTSPVGATNQIRLRWLSTRLTESKTPLMRAWSGESPTPAQVRSGDCLVRNCVDFGCTDYWLRVKEMSNLGRTGKEVTFPCRKPRQIETSSTRERKNGTVPLVNWEFGMPGTSETRNVRHNPERSLLTPVF